MIASTVDLMAGKTSAYFSGVLTCGSIWVCAPCSARIRAGRSIEVERAATRWLRGSTEKARGAGGAVFLTITLRHFRKHSLKTLYDALAQGWREMMGGRAGAAMRAKYGLEHSIRAVEVKYGTRSGWHPHIHVLLLTGTVLSAAQIASLEATVYERWATFIDRKKLPTLRSKAGRKHSVRAQQVNSVKELATYLTKVQGADGKERSLAAEITRADGKRDSVTGNVTPFQMLEDPDGTYRKPFIEYANATRGRRAIEWSKGLRALLDVEDLSDAEIAEQEPESDEVDEILASFYPDDWWAIRANGAQAAVLDLAETGGLAATLAFVAGLRLQRDSDQASVR